MDKLVLINFRYENESGTNVKGQLLLPFNGGIAYKPVHVLITEGFLDLSHRFNHGVSSEGLRKQKERFISKYCNLEEGSMSPEIKIPFLLNEGKPIGLVLMMSYLCGYNANNAGKLFFEIEGFEKYKAAKLFQNLREPKNTMLEIVNKEWMFDECLDYINALKAYYNKSIKTASIVIQKMEEK